MRQFAHFITARPKIVVGVFFGLLLLIGVLSYRDFGLSWDEKTQYLLGKEAYEAVFKGKKWPTHTGYRFHGASLEILFHIVREWVKFESIQNIFFMRHFLNFLTLYIGVAFFFVLGTRFTRSWKLGLLGCVFLVLSPRIFGHGFFNSRDIPTMSLFIVSMWTLCRFLDTRTVMSTVVHALACALLISIRMTGIFLPAITVFFLVLEGFHKRNFSCKQFNPLFFYLIALSIFTIAFWPLLWEHPIKHFIDAYRYMSTKSAGGFYMGKVYNHNPWHWIPVWMSITTPLLYTALFVLGLIQYGKLAVREPLSFFSVRRNDLIILFWLFAPILAIITLRAGIFDTWRHVFFLYPAFLLISLKGLQWLLQISNPMQRYVVSAMITISMCLTALWMVRNHPLQYVYFSVPTSIVEKRFELDYWGLSFRQGFEWIMENDDDPIIPIHATSSPAFSTINILPAKIRERIFFTGGTHTPKYLLDNFQWQNYSNTVKEEQKVYTVSVGGIEVLAVYKNPDWKPYTIDPSVIPNTSEVIFY